MAAQKSLPWLLWLLSALGLFLAGGLFLAVSLAPFQQLKPLADSLAPDGSLDAFNQAAYSQARPFFWGTALALLACGAVAVWQRGNIQATFARMLAGAPRRALSEDLLALKAELRLEKTAWAHLLSLALITALGVANRALRLSAPMQHDEAYTYIAFASRPVGELIRDYSLPNNHIFHSLLVHISSAWFGNQPWSVRLPAFLAGALMIPAAYALGARLYNRSTGLIGAALTAASPVLIGYSANARGYTLICLFTLVIAWLASFLLRQPNRLAWGLLALCASLGFYTIPIMLYPFGMIVAWLILSWLSKDVNAAYRATFWRYGGAMLAATLVLTGLLYLPVFLHSGVGAVIHNEYVQPQEIAGLGEQIWSRVITTARQWTAQTPAFFAPLSLAGLALSLALHPRISRYRMPLQLAAMAWIALAIAIQRVAPLARVWMFLLPLYLIWAAAGALGLFELLIPEQYHRRIAWLAILLALLIPGLSLSTDLNQGRATAAEPGVEEEIALYLQQTLLPGDLVVVQAPMAAPLEYYFRRYGLPLEAFDRQREDVRRLLVIVSDKYEQTVESVLQRKGLQGYLQRSSHAEPIHRYKHTTLYALTP